MMSLSYQLEVLAYQAQRMRGLGWAQYLDVAIAPDRKSFTASYWVYVALSPYSVSNDSPLLLQTATFTQRPR
jgi:mediator of RNA polymerase II transcription subunit 14